VPVMETMEDRQTKKSRAWLESAWWRFSAPWTLGRTTEDQFEGVAFSKRESWSLGQCYAC
jgi:hypothetical protein